MFEYDDPVSWRWTAMILQPDLVTSEIVERAKGDVTAKRGLRAVREVRLEPLREGRAAQILHMGPYAAEQPTIEKLHAFIREQGLRPAGKHHEIYVSDPRRTAPERLRTVIREPVSA